MCLVDHDRHSPIMPREERHCIGLSAHTWRQHELRGITYLCHSSTPFVGFQRPSFFHEPPAKHTHRRVGSTTRVQLRASRSRTSEANDDVLSLSVVDARPVTVMTSCPSVSPLRSISRSSTKWIQTSVRLASSFPLLDASPLSAVDGLRLVYEREVPLELRTYDGTNFPAEVPNPRRSLSAVTLPPGRQRRATQNQSADSRRRKPTGRTTRKPNAPNEQTPTHPLLNTYVCSPGRDHEREQPLLPFPARHELRGVQRNSSRTRPPIRNRSLPTSIDRFRSRSV